MRLRELQRARLDDSSTDFQRRAPAQPIETMGMVLDDRRIAFIHTVDIFQQSTARFEILGEEQRGEIRAAPTEQHRATLNIVRDEARDDQHRVIAQMLVQMARVQRNGRRLVRLTMRAQACRASIDVTRRHTVCY